MKLFRRQRTNVTAVHPGQFGKVKNSRRFVQPFGGKDLFQFFKRENFLLGSRVPPQQGNIVQNGFGQITFGNQILERSIAVAFAQLMLGIFHYLRHMNVNRRRPAERFINEIIFRRGRNIFVAADNMSDFHQVIVNHVGKIISGETV